MKLYYKTRGNRSPQGKPRVYFCCHPADFDRCFTPISDEILAKQDCSIWYDAEPETAYDNEEFRMDLGQMQLFVVPVTTRFLCEPNRGRDVEFAFAVDCQIPILPLMQEGGLEELFNETCGNLQTLNKYNRDRMAISYDEKLEKFLASVLVGDELAGRIRSAFEAYIFLSYRKMDRRYAQELMRLIHENEFCRDIAIWYDEFLTPGEDFNETIRNALQKSSLFALVVTPNILRPNAMNEDNFVMKTEYPMAQAEGKPVFPAEIRTTNKHQLREKFPGLPGCADARIAHDEEAFADALQGAVEKMNLPKGDASPEKDYLIGLAYLSGVDMEVDRERAVARIRAAADAGYTEAMEKMVSMYRTGEGVKRDYRTAIEWQEKLAGCRRAQFASSLSPDDAAEWATEALKLSDYYYEMQDLGPAGAVLEEMRGLLEFFALNENYSDFWYYLPTVYERLGNVIQAQGQLEKAQEYYRKGLELSGQIAEEDTSGSVMGDYAVNCERMANIYRREGRLQEAREYYQMLLDLSCRLLEEEENPEYYLKRNVAVAWEDMGDISFDEGDLDSAKRYYEESFSAFCRLEEEDAERAETRDGIARLFSRMGDVSLARGNLDQAWEYYDRMLQEFQELEKETGTVESRWSLVHAYYRIGDVSEKGGYAEKAETYYKISEERCRELRQEADTVNFQADHAVILGSLSYVNRMEGRLEEAEVWEQEALELRKRLVRETGAVEARGNLGSSYRNLGSIYEARELLPEARRNYEEGLKLWRQLAEETGTIKARSFVGALCENLGCVCQTEGNLKEAERYYKESMNVFRQLTRETEDAEIWNDLADICGRRATLCQMKGDGEEADRYFLEGEEVVRQLGKKTGSARARINLSTFLERRGANLQQQGRQAEARACYEECLDIRKKLYEETGTSHEKMGLSCSYERMGDICQAEGDFGEAAEHYEESRRLRQELMEETGTAEARRNLSISLERMGSLWWMAERLDEAQRYYEGSMNIIRQLMEETGTQESRRNLAVICDRLGMICCEQESLKEGRKYYEESLRLRLALQEESDWIEIRRDLGISYRNLGGVCLLEERQAEAEEYYEKSMEACRQLCEETEEAVDYDNLATTCYEASSAGGGKGAALLKEACRIWKNLSARCPDNTRFQNCLELALSELKNRKEAGI